MNTGKSIASEVDSTAACATTCWRPTEDRVGRWVQERVGTTRARQGGDDERETGWGRVTSSKERCDVWTLCPPSETLPCWHLKKSHKTECENDTVLRATPEIKKPEISLLPCDRFSLMQTGMTPKVFNQSYIRPGENRALVFISSSVAIVCCLHHYCFGILQA